MKNKKKFIILLVFLSIFQYLNAENLNIKSSSISIDKKTRLTVFKENVVVTDAKQNILKTNFAEYDKDLELLESKGKTTILTSEGYLINGENIIFDNLNNFIKSNNPATIIDLENNNIFLDKFEYSTVNNLFKSTGKIKIIDSKKNIYNFSQIFIDEKKREIVGTDIKSFINQESFKVSKNNKPRVFANTVNINNEQTEFIKSVFTMCNFRSDDKCPPWSLQADKMRHDKKKKTIFYDNAVIKVYDIPIFYIPRISHPDPTVSRRSGFLPPTISNAKTLGSGIQIPYFWAINDSKDLTLTSKLFSSEHPLLLGEYRQAFSHSNLILDFGYTEGYKKKTTTKKLGNKSHFFSKYVKNFIGKNNSDNNLELNFQNLSHDKYLKLYKIKTNLIDGQVDNLENSLNFTHDSEDIFFGFNVSAYETLSDNYNDKYEYILPEINLAKNLFNSENFGYADFESNLKIHNYDTNKSFKFIVNDIDWKLKNYNFSSGVNTSLIGQIKNVNYDAKNVDKHKENTTNELFGALGLLSKIDLYKGSSKNNLQLLTPKILIRYSPEHMKKETTSTRLNQLNVFSLDRLNTPTNFESGLNATLGFDYEFNKNEKNLKFSAAQIINEKENKNMPSSSSLDEKLSDLVASTNFKINNKVNFDYNFSLDQNYKDLNYNEIGANLNFSPFKIRINYLEEKKHIGDQQYVQNQLEFAKGNNGLFTFENKRNLITNSSEYYNLSYEYINDCLRAGLVYRREFYNDSELEPENSLMFKITLIPFGNLNSPSFNK